MTLQDTATDDKPVNDCRGLPALDQRKQARKPNRRRLNLNATVHADTLDRLDRLTSRFATSRGQLLDRLVLVLATAYESGKVLCIDGSSCPVGRVNLPQLY